MKYYFFLFMLFLLTNCQLQDNNSPESVDKPLSAWAEAYFNFDYKEALEYMTPESEKWIRFTATNITQQDIDFIKEQGKTPRIEILNRHILADDTTCTASIRVSDFVQLGFVGKDNKVVDQAEYQITLVKHNGEWLVRMEGQPQSERQSRD